MIRIKLSTRLGERRWTQAKLSRESGVRAATISEWYNEIAERITLSDLFKICMALNCRVEDLLELEYNPEVDQDELSEEKK